MTALNRGLTQYAQAVDVAKLSPGGSVFLKKAIDPYHDFPIPHSGYPDCNNSMTVVQEVKRSIQISSAGLDFNAGPSPQTSWNFQIDLMPMLNKILVNPAVYDSTNGLITSNGYNELASMPAVYPLQMCASLPLGPTGQSLYAWPDDNQDQWASVIGGKVVKQYTGLEPGFQYVMNPCRIVAAAFEVVNTTRVLDINGTVTTYRNQDVSSRKPFITNISTEPVGTPLTVNDPPVTFSENVNYIMLPPTELQDIMLLNGSQQWLAKDGCYVVAALDLDNGNPFSVWFQRTNAFFASYVPTVTSGGLVNGLVNSGVNSSFRTVNNLGAIAVNENSATSWAAAHDAIVGSTTDYQTFFAPFCKVAIKPCGALFTGLSIDTTFTVNVRWLIERIPDYTSDLIVLAKPSAPFDDRAIKLYMQVAQQLPTGCTVKENPLGEWFEKVCKIVSMAAPVILGAVGLEPVGGIIAGAATSLGAYNRSLRVKY